MTTDPAEAQAWAASQGAHAPYSGLHVGAALVCTDGTVWTGCNVENGSFGLTLCAERAAVAAAVVAGHRDFERIVIVSDAGRPIAPCGACRQVLAEFADDLSIVSIAKDGRRSEWRLGELLPAAFRFGEGVSSE